MKKVNNPQPQDLKDKTYTRTWAYHQSINKVVLNRARHIVDLMRFLSGRTVLDVGCGAGVLVNALERAGYDATGVDVQPETIDYAQKTQKGTYILTDGLTTLKYDFILATHVLEHIVDPDSFVSKARERLNDKGYFIVSVPNYNSYSEKSIWRRTVANLINDPDHVWAWTPDDLRQLFIRHNIVPQKVITRTDSPDILTGVVRTIVNAFKGKKLSIDNPGIFTPVVSRDKISAYERFANNRIVMALLEPFNRMSERKERGVELIIIGRKV